MRQHGEQHEAWLAEFLAGERPAPAAEAELARRTEACAECRASWERLRAVSARLQAAGRERGAVLAELAAAEHASASAPGEERVLGVLESLAAAAPRRRLWRGWLLGVAAALLGVVLLRAFLGRTEDAPAPVTLGEEIHLVAPAAVVPEIERFEWTYGGDAASFTLSIFADDRGARGGLLDEVPGLSESTWTPSPEKLRAWPARILWRVEARDDFGRPLASLERSCRRSSR